MLCWCNGPGFLLVQEVPGGRGLVLVFSPVCPYIDGGNRIKNDVDAEWQLVCCSSRLSLRIQWSRCSAGPGPETAAQKTWPTSSERSRPVVNKQVIPEQL